MDFSGMSADQLERIAREANELAVELRRVAPTANLALANGVVDRGYNTVRYGYVPSYSGTAVIKMEDGRVWRAVGHPSAGSASHVSRRGYIEFIPLLESESPAIARE